MQTGKTLKRAVDNQIAPVQGLPIVYGPPMGKCTGPSMVYGPWIAHGVAEEYTKCL